MTQMKTRLSIFALALVALAATPTLGLARGSSSNSSFGNSSNNKKFKPPEHHETTIATVTADSITISEDKTKLTYPITKFVEVTIDGQKATAADLKPGMLVSVTKADQTRLSRITAT